MPRKKKLRKADTVEFQGITVDIMYDPNDLIFRAKFMDNDYSDDRAASLKHTVYCRMKESLQLRWIPVIKVHLIKPFACRDYREPFIGFLLERFRIAVRPDGNFLRVNWSIAPDDDLTGYISGVQRLYLLHLKDGEEFSLPYSEKDFGHDGTTIYLEYSEELWAGLTQLQEAIIAAKERLTELVGTETGLTHIAAIGSNLLKMLPEPASLTETLPIGTADPAEIENLEDAEPVIHKAHFKIDPAILATMTDEEGEEDVEI